MVDTRPNTGLVGWMGHKIKTFNHLPFQFYRFSYVRRVINYSLYMWLPNSSTNGCLIQIARRVNWPFSPYPPYATGHGCGGAHMDVSASGALHIWSLHRRRCCSMRWQPHEPLGSSASLVDSIQTHGEDGSKWNTPNHSHEEMRTNRRKNKKIKEISTSTRVIATQKIIQKTSLRCIISTFCSRWHSCWSTIYKISPQ